MKKKIAIVNQRYGIEVNGGSEYYTRMLAERLQKHYEVEVLTTTALDYDTWAPYYPEGLQSVNQINVRRFAVDKQRNMKHFSQVDRLMRNLPWLRCFLEPLWIRTQGPYCPMLIRYIKEHKEDYDVFIFVTYLYYTSLAGIPEVRDKVVFVPTAHDEYCIYFHSYRNLFNGIKGIAYLTQEEQDFVQNLFHTERIPHCVAGAGIEIPASIDHAGFCKKYKIDSEYIIYVGRVDISKKCDELFEYFIKFQSENEKTLKLIVVGKVMMDVPEDTSIKVVGFVTEKEKYAAIAGARALVMPSEYESLSLVVLEAMALGVPVVVNRACAVLESHCKKSLAGISYSNYKQFERAMEQMLEAGIGYRNMQTAGRRYVKQNYSWTKTVEQYKKLIDG